MDSMTVSEFKDALTRAGKMKGAAGVTLQKKLILDKFMITDEAGMAVDPETLDVTISAGAAAEVLEDSAKAEEITKSIRSEVARRMDAPKFAAIANLDDKPWERARVYGRLKGFQSKESAYRFGSWCLATLGHSKSAQFCKSNGINVKAHTEGVNAAGGFLVPDEFENELIVLREQYGVFRRNARVWRMASDTLRIPRKNNGLTAYWVGEAIAGTESTNTFDSIQLVAKKLMCLTTVSNELLEDSVIDLAGDVASEIAYQFAFKEDDAGFNGDGTSTYGGVVGLATLLSDATYQVSDSGVASHALQTTTTVSTAIAKLPNWATQRNNVKIFCNKSTYHGVFERLLASSGGATFAEVSAGTKTPTYLGYPVEFSQALAYTPTTDGSVIAYIGDLAQGCYLGDRRSTSIAFSDSALNAFEQDERVVRGTQRVDIVCANVGSSAAAGALIKFTV